jgi:hypothetical protein
MDYQPYLGWGLNNFEDVINTFTKYPDGGWWIKKIDYKDAFHREITEGPYSEEEAKEKAQTWNKFFNFKDITTAKALSFKKLMCKNNIDKEIKDNIYEEYIWKPPKGAELMCLIYQEQKVLLTKKTDNISFEKFKMYVLEQGIKLINIDDFEIFYKKNDYMALKQANILKQLVEGFKDNLSELWILYNYALNNDNTTTPLYIPEYIKNFNIDDKPYTLDFFKKFNRCKTREEKIKKLVECLKNNKLPLIYDEKDYIIKNIVISYNKKTFVLEIKNENFFVKLVAPEDKIAKLTFEIPFINSTVLSKDDELYSKKTIYLMLFIAKTMSINNIILKDNLKEHCRCAKFDKPIYINILRFIVKQDSIYEEVGFTEQNRGTRDEIIYNFRNKTVGELLGDNNENLFYNKTVEELVTDYLDGYCQYEYVCDIIHYITSEINKILKENCLEYFIDLKKVNLINLKF